MANNITKVDQIHSQMPKALGTKKNRNWSGLIDAIGSGDDYIANLIEAARKEFFIKTADNPYLNRLGANNNVTRPSLLGMKDATFRKYVPLLTYQPKQVKNIIDQLLNIFFSRESTTAFAISLQPEPYLINDGWTIEYTVDGQYAEVIQFRAADFTDINQVTAEELAEAWNRQARYSFAVTDINHSTQQVYIKLFTNTIGSKGSIVITGGLADISLQFTGFISQAGAGLATQWNVDKIGDLIIMQYIGGDFPGLQFLEVGDVILCYITVNDTHDTASIIGSFVLESIDIPNNSISFRDPLGTAGVAGSTITTTANFINLIPPGITYTIAEGITAEVTDVMIQGELDIGGELDLGNTSNTTFFSGNVVRFFNPVKNTVTAALNRAIMWEVESGNITIEVPTTSPIISRLLRGGAYLADSLPLDPNDSLGTKSYSNSRTIIATSLAASSFLGPYLIDPTASFVLSGITADTLQQINAGDIARILDLTSSLFPASGSLMFDFGKATQEGPVKYLYKANDYALALDPSYIFQYNHLVGSSVTLLHSSNTYATTRTAATYPPYVTDPTQAQGTLEQLVSDVTSVGIFINWLVRYPEQLYSMVDIYATIRQEES